MRAFLKWWPFMLASTHEAVRRENYTLRDALREANRELAKHRRFVAAIKAGSVDVVKVLDRIAAEEARR